MRRLILAVLLCLSAESAYADWTKITSTSDSDMYADFSTIRRKDHTVKMWVLHDYHKPQATPDNKPYLSIKILAQFDCAEEESRFLASIDYAEGMGTGDPLSSYYTPSKWTPIIPRSIAETMKNVACPAE
ncbi:MAG: surface-adhesin E family protein [Nitrospira sp.]|nr:surface-adhesin E family protein [Nitrospira sp.]